MGKKRLEKIKESGEVSLHITPKQAVKWVRERIGDKTDAFNDRVTEQVRAKMAVTRWMPYQGVTSLTELDMSDPVVSLEWTLCDQRILKDLLRPGGRKRLLALLTEEEKDVYLNKVDKNGARYTDLETGEAGMTKKNIAKAAVNYWRYYKS